MIIKNTYLLNFRNFRQLNMNFSDNINIIIGDNAQGKTNILEAVYFSAKAKSFRQVKDKDMINFEKNLSYIRTDIDTDGIYEKIEMKLSKKSKKTVRINEEIVDTIRELRTFFDIVVFTPEDMKIIKDSKSFRRNFIDDIISSINPNYAKALSNYNRVLNQRNHILKNGRYEKYFKEQLNGASKQLAKEGSLIILYRIKYISSLEKAGQKIHKNLSDDVELLELKYDSEVLTENFNKNVSLGEIEERFYNLLVANYSKDMRYKYTTIGCHRDDLIINIDKKSAKNFASQGQQRTALLTLKLAQLKMIKYYKDTDPVILLDDVFSELDDNRISYLLDMIRGYQSLITCTNTDIINKFNMKNTRVFQLDNGKIDILRN